MEALVPVVLQVMPVSSGLLPQNKKRNPHLTGMVRNSTVTKLGRKASKRRTKHTCSHCSNELGSKMSIGREATYVGMFILEVSSRDTFFRTQEIGVLRKTAYRVLQHLFLL